MWKNKQTIKAYFFKLWIFYKIKQAWIEKLMIISYYQKIVTEVNEFINYQLI